MELTDAQKQQILAAEAGVLSVLKQYGCHLEGVTVLRPGNVDVQILVAINAPQPDAPAAPAFTTPPVNPTLPVEDASAAPSEPTAPVADTPAAE